MPWSMTTLVAPVVVQLNVVLLPAVIVARLAVIVAVGTAFTVTVTLAVFVPAAFVAVTVYIVVTSGDTACDPVSVTVPIPWSMLTEVAFAELQLKVAESPAVMDVGCAVMLTAGTFPTVTVTLAVVVP